MWEIKLKYFMIGAVTHLFLGSHMAWLAVTGNVSFFTVTDSVSYLSVIQWAVIYMTLCIFQFSISCARLLNDFKEYR